MMKQVEAALNGMDVSAVRVEGGYTSLENRVGLETVQEFDVYSKETTKALDRGGEYAS